MKPYVKLTLFYQVNAFAANKQEYKKVSHLIIKMLEFTYILELNLCFYE
jgi:hypothetical protein